MYDVLSVCHCKLLSCNLFELFYAEEYRDLENNVRCRSRSFKSTHFDKYGFLFAFHSNYGPILNRFRDKARCWLKIAFLIPFLHNSHLENGCEYVYNRARSSGLNMFCKKFAIYWQFKRVTDGKSISIPERATQRSAKKLTYADVQTRFQPMLHIKLYVLINATYVRLLWRGIPVWTFNE